ncbi:hypothetical protein FSP39_003510 [Pinctada imbricata]|uniref:Tyr recombinase domain-containing protein n=1 Tax=Pinctada imbricata TaxID=66713 RepID=A0AA89C8W2_PINIB|nr:hypothetical protein FSP39_003510 [Pinctada imbricata]
MGRWKKIEAETDPQLKELGSALPELFVASKSINTVKKYRYGFKEWCEWCKKFNSISTVPASDYHVCLFIMSLMRNNASVSKIEQAIYSISWAQYIAGYDNPCESVLVKNIVEGARRKLSRPVVKKEPITPDILCKLVERFGMSDNLYDKRIVTMCLIGYASFMRFSELSSIRISDLDLSDNKVSIFIEKSKTDKYRDGSWIHIAKTDKITCPVKMLLQYIKLADLKLNDDNYLFRQVSFCRSSGSYVLRKSGKLSYTRVRELLLEKLSALGMEASKFGLHSLRSGGATAAANAGVPDRLFKKHGRWKSEKAKDGYVRENVNTALSVSMQIGI